jgi:hypothetical protein
VVSVDLESRAETVEVRAEITSGASDAAAALERIAGRLSLEPSVSGVRWKLAGGSDEES